MKYLAYLALISVSGCGLSEQRPQLNAVDQLQWSNRILVVWSDHPQTTLNELMTEHGPGIDDRDMIVFAMREDEMFTNYSGELGPTLTSNLAATFPNNRAVFFLIGKDGGTKDRGKQLDIMAIFAQIDRMPMRIQEMRSRPDGSPAQR